MAISLSDKARKRLTSSIQEYYRVERGEAIGELQASLLLDFVLREIGPSIYNQGVRDSQARLVAFAADLDVALEETELDDTPGRNPRNH